MPYARIPGQEGMGNPKKGLKGESIRTARGVVRGFVVQGDGKAAQTLAIAAHNAGSR